MSDTQARLREYLACYGSDTDAWPREARALTRGIAAHPELAALFEEERRFERLLSERRDEEAAPDFGARIIAAARRRPQAADPLAALPAQMRPAALAAMLVLGFIIGFNAISPPASTAGSTVTAQSLSDDEGAVL